MHIMPVELAIPLYLSREEFHCSRAPKLMKPLRPCLHSYSNLHSNSGHHKQQPIQQQTHASLVDGRGKKQVSFADHKGLALTMVKIFSEFDDPIEIPLNVRELFSGVANPLPDRSKLVLDFAQPSSDYPVFRQRLDQHHVCLEHCMLKEKALAGTVKVKNLSFHKTVKVRVTFDTWKSHTDIECQYVQDTYASLDRDTFSFEVNLPDIILAHERIEFAVSYEVNGQTYWDSNQGQNYRIVQAALKTRGPVGCNLPNLDQLGIHLDRYGSPRCSHGLFPEWPSYATYEEIGPYY